MKKYLIAIPILIFLAACTKTQVNMANPASVYCEQQGNTLEIQTAPDGSQSGICIFPDGSTCDEWAYFRGECGPATSNSKTPSAGIESTPLPPPADGSPAAVVDWWGVIKSNPPGAQFDDYFERQDQGQAIRYGIDSLDPAVRAQIEALRDTGQVVHLYGTLLSDVPDVNGTQIQVERIVVSE
jgi:putative hemolysin